MISAKIHITLKNGILDPQGKTVLQALENLGIQGVSEVRIGKFINMDFGDVSRDKAEKLTHEACRQLLANPVIEDYRIELVGEDGRSS